MGEIQRYHWTRYGMRTGCAPTLGVDKWVLAAALEAQAEEHNRDLARLADDQEDTLARAQADRVSEVNNLNAKHAAELAEKDEEHKSEIATHRVNSETQRRRIVHYTNQLAELRGEGEPALASPDDIRALGWVVAIHNDYQILQQLHTSWLFTKDGRAVKGEGSTDAIALNQVREEIDND